MIRGDNISSLRVGSIRLSIVNPVAVTGYCSWFESCPYHYQQQLSLLGNCAPAEDLGRELANGLNRAGSHRYIRHRPE